jgi:hypothetical protein
MAGFSFDISPLMRMSKDIQRIGENVKKNEAAVVKLAANEYKNDVQEIIQYKSGTLRRSVHVEMDEEDGHPVALVGTDAPYARRLEYGFVDVDSLGRHYNQSPAPRWRPAFDHNLAKYERMAKGVFSREGWDRDVATEHYYRTELSGRI